MYLVSWACITPWLNGQSMQMDVTGNRYIWNGSEVIKKEKATRLEFRNNFLSSGNIKQLDLNQPMRPVLFFEDTQQLIFADNTLSPMSILELSPLNLGWIVQICTSKWGGIWVWDNSQKTLYKIDKNGAIILSIPNFSNSAYLSDWEVKWMAEDGNHLFIRDNAHLLVLDILGGIEQCIAVSAFNPTWLVNGEIWESNGQNLQCLYPSMNRSIPFNLHPVYLHRSGIYSGTNFETWTPWP